MFAKDTSGNLIYVTGLIIEAPMKYPTTPATGYGKKIATSKKLFHEGRAYRIYCAIYSNSGTCYIVKKGQRFPINEGGCE